MKSPDYVFKRTSYLLTIILCFFVLIGVGAGSLIYLITGNVLFLFASFIVFLSLGITVYSFAAYEKIFLYSNHIIHRRVGHTARILYKDIDSICLKNVNEKPKYVIQDNKAGFLTIIEPTFFSKHYRELFFSSIKANGPHIKLNL